ncbi:BQ5605_C018g08602 [Microbotryum silenes-dioicae]|uniref:BQ5605_C018g08602 protein n=1 Tax=Microbotryum silenes-dioicae TaxID=796604 RepID=A0A2X0MIA7_9BASI|nr:BQ5605_C018g08602 [Microbotryum silenes-dioicae]
MASFIASSVPIAKFLRQTLFFPSRRALSKSCRPSQWLAPVLENILAEIGVDNDVRAREVDTADDAGPISVRVDRVVPGNTGERAIARADKIANAMEGKGYFSQGLFDYFFGNLTAWEVRNKVWPENFAIGTEEAMEEVIAAVNKIVSQEGGVGWLHSCFW